MKEWTVALGTISTWRQATFTSTVKSINVTVILFQHSQRWQSLGFYFKIVSNGITVSVYFIWTSTVILLQHNPHLCDCHCDFNILDSSIIVTVILLQCSLHVVGLSQFIRKELAFSQLISPISTRKDQNRKLKFMNLVVVSFQIIRWFYMKCIKLGPFLREPMTLHVWCKITLLKADVKRLQHVAGMLWHLMVFCTSSSASCH